MSEEYEQIAQKLQRRGWWIKPLLVILMLLIISFTVIRLFIVVYAVITDDSMFPSLIEGDEVLVYRMTNTYDRGNIILFMEGDHPSIRRVIAGPGDVIEVRKGFVWINDQPLEIKKGKTLQMGIHVKGQDALAVHKCEQYEETNKGNTYEICISGGKKLKPKDQKRLKIPSNNYFVMCDNRSFCQDSRHFGTISADSVIGRVDYLQYPADERGLSWYKRWFGIWKKL